MRDIEDDQELLDLLIHDGAMQDAIWEPTAFWKPYCDHIRNELSRASLKQFRRNPRLTRGFEKLPPAKKELFDKGARGRIAKILLGVPPLNRIGARYERYLKSLIKDLEQGYEKEIALAYYALQSGRISKDILSHVDDSEVGCPYRCEIGGRKYTLKVLSQVCYLSLLCHMENFNKFRRIIEIGGGYGAFAEVVHKWKGDNIKYFVLVDIPPQIYIATQYLKAVFPGKVLDYKNVHELASIEASHINGKILIIPPWVIPRLHLEFDLLWNAASFQEMEKGVVLNYLRLLSKSTWNIFLVSLIEGLPKGFHGQKEPISLAWLIDSITKMDYTYSRCEKDCVEKNVFDLIAYDKKTLIYDVGYFRRKDQ